MKGHCCYCERKLNPPHSGPDPLKKTIDHLVPRSKGGSNRRNNLKSCCSQCNTLKDDMLPQEFLAFLRIKQSEGDYRPYDERTIKIMIKNIKALISKLRPFRINLVTTIYTRLKSPASSLRQIRSQQEYWRSIYKEYPHVCRLLLNKKKRDLPEWVYKLKVRRR